MDESGNIGEQPLSTLSDEQLKELLLFAESMLDIHEIALIIDVPDTELKEHIRIDGSKANKAFNKGRLIAKAAINKSIIDCAKQGSHPAHSMAQKMISNTIKKDANELDK